MTRTEYDKAYYAANRERIAARKTAWIAANPERHYENGKAWREANREHMVEYRKAYAAANPGRKAETTRKWRAADPERHAEYARAYRAANRERVNATAKAYQERNRERRAEYRKAYNAANPEKIAKLRRARALRKYGLTTADYDAMLAAQDGRCAICRTDNPGAPAFHVDHCHQSGATRGLLCSPCNTGIGLLRDDPALLRAAIAYIEAQATSRQPA